MLASGTKRVWLMSLRGNLHVRTTLDSDKEGEKRLPHSLGGVKRISPEWP